MWKLLVKTWTWTWRTPAITNTFTSASFFFLFCESTRCIPAVIAPTTWWQTHLLNNHQNMIHIFNLCESRYRWDRRKLPNWSLMMYGHAWNFKTLKQKLWISYKVFFFLSFCLFFFFSQYHKYSYYLILYKNWTTGLLSC